MSNVNAGDLHQLARLLREVALAATANRGQRGVPVGHLAIVEDVATHHGASVGEIAERTGLAQSLVSRTVASMRDAGVLRTEPDPADARRVRVSVDPKARRMFRSRGARPVAPALRDLRPDASSKDLRRAETLLDELASLLL